MSGRGGSNGSGGTQACAACKYQRRKCTPDCILAPYFPPDQQRQFLNAHKLFGVSNILKIIRNLDPLQKGAAMRSIMFQSDARARDPVGGCHRIILELQRQIERSSAELDIAIRQLALCREQQTQLSDHHGQFGLNMNSTVVMNDYNNLMHSQEQQQQQHYHYRQDLNPWMVIQQQQQQQNSHATTPILVSHECDDMKPLVEMFDRKQSFVDESDESFPSSSRVGLEEEHDSMGQDQEHDLKGAASFLTLKNNNTSGV